MIGTLGSQNKALFHFELSSSNSIENDICVELTESLSGDMFLDGWVGFEYFHAPVSNEAFHAFLHEIDEAGFSDWYGRYEPLHVDYESAIRWNMRFKQVVSRGYDVYPQGFNQLVSALETLAGDGDLPIEPVEELPAGIDCEARLIGAWNRRFPAPDEDPSGNDIDAALAEEADFKADLARFFKRNPVDDGSDAYALLGTLKESIDEVGFDAAVLDGSLRATLDRLGKRRQPF